MSHFDPKRLHCIDDFFMPQLNRHRGIHIYLPNGYDDSSLSYPVIYMHDGQNVIDPQRSSYGDSWQVPTTLDRMQTRGDIMGCIVVAIDNGAECEGMGRFNEYSPWIMDQEFDLPSRDSSIYKLGGEGKAYCEFIVNTLKPYIDTHFRSLPQRQHTALVGSSMGGLISLYGAMDHLDCFGFCGVFSPAFWFNEAKVFEFIRKKETQSTKSKLPLSIYMDMGTNETSDDSRLDFSEVYLDGARKMKIELETKHSNVSLSYQEEEGAVHNEQAWAKRFPDMMAFFEDTRTR